MTWAEDATMSEGKQCLQRDVTEADVSRSGAGNKMLDVCCVPTSHEEESNNDLSRARKVYHNSEWKPHQDAVYWIHLAKAQEKGLHFFWLARSHAIIHYDSVPTDCIEKEVHQGGDNTSNQRLSTPRPAPKTVLKDVWELRQQQQQQQQNTLLSTGKLLAE